MPLGFGRAILSKTAVAAGGTTTAARAFFSNRTSTSSDVATYQVEMTVGNRFASSNVMTWVYWIRVTANDLGGTNQYRLMTYRDSLDLGGGQAWLSNGADGGVSYVAYNLYNGTRNVIVYSMKSGTTYGDSQTAFRDNFLDGSWHCVMARCDLNNGSIRNLYIDGEEHASNNTYGSSPDTNTGTNPKLNDIRYVSLRVQPANDTTGGYGNLNQDLPAADTGPIWFYDSNVDITNSTTRAYYYDNSETDGYVDGGTDGTAGGATQPELYLYHTASTLVNGGSLSPTIATATNGSGTITVIADTDGPGSGGTRS